MRKLTIAICIFATALFACACTSNSDITEATWSSAPEPVEEEYEQDSSALREYAPDGSDITIEASDGVINVSILFSRNSPTQQDFAAMGRGIYYSKIYCDSAFAQYALKYCMADLGSASNLLIWSSSIGDWGSVIDNRSGEAKVTTFDNLDDLCAFFPTLSKDVRMDTLDPQDSEIYNDVMSALDSRPNDSEEEIYAELAPKYSMTSQQLYIFMKDIMEKVYSTSMDFDPKTPLVYPAFSESPLFGWYPMAPEIIFSTPASENGLGNNIYSFIGTVREFGSIDNSGSEMQYFILDTKIGPVLLYDIYGWGMDQYPDLYELYAEPNSDYSFPNKSAYVKVYGVYQGYSDVFDMPSCTYGIPQFVTNAG